MSLINIRDIAVIAPCKKDGARPVAPTGEFNKHKEYAPMSADERIAMVERLYDSMSILMDEAKNVHLKHSKMKHDVTRLITHEFFFYTQQPLTLQEFESLQNKIGNKIEQLPAGIQFILGSFAVMSPGDKVMNVTPHIASGTQPSFNFIVKNHTSPIDPCYQRETFGFFKALHNRSEPSNPSPSLPKIKISDTEYDFSFNNIVHCKTAGNIPFITAVDVCLDHHQSVGQNNFDKLNNYEKNQACSHVVVSNCINIEESKCVGQVTHVDPLFGRTTLKKAKVDVKNQTSKNSFLKATELFYIPSKGYTPKPLIGFFDVLPTLKFGSKDKFMDQYIAQKEEEYSNAKTDEEHQLVLDELKATYTSLQFDPVLEEIRSITENFRKNASLFTIGMKNKADRIENALNRIPVSERCNLLQSEHKEIVFKALASHRSFGKRGVTYENTNGGIDINKSASTFKAFKEKFRDKIDKDKESNKDELANKPEQYR